MRSESYEQYRPLQAKEMCVRDPECQFFLADNRRQLQRAGTATDEWGILIVSFGQVGWQRFGVVYCKQNTVIQPWGGTAWDGALGHFTLSRRCHGHLADMCKPLKREKETWRRGENESNKGGMNGKKRGKENERVRVGT